jgi:hypothetical protein
MEKETTDYVDLGDGTKTRVIPSAARDLAKTHSLSKNIARDLCDRVHICEVLRRLRGSG